ncbi:hypothetical protein C8R43DRAFT_899354 [Mycena crocata]|nr:hypothetical protein C8R43DRAFT_899354 [Mycena crocata]
MRYGACTSDDIDFLRTRIASDRPGHPHLDTKKYRNVSVITGLNIHKDLINDEGTRRFAQDTGQKLVEFYSIDKLSARKVDRRKWRRCEQAHFKRLGPKLQHALWSATPSATAEHIPGCLKLCVGMPVMIKVNEATELCITKGQEAVVVGWDSSIGPSDQKILDTLFVRLVDPAKEIQIPDLPLNVVPLGRTSIHITCLLRDDSLLSVTREQVIVLPNFAMTDYGSQGRSRNPNVVHLNNCKNHHNYYVALSRGYEAIDTVIIQGFDPKKITSGINGHLRQEFRELELLDEITKLRYEGRLPKRVRGIYRRQLLTCYRAWKGNVKDPVHFHPAIRSQAEDETETEYGVWKPSILAPAGNRTAKNFQNKRKPEEHPDVPAAKKQATTTTHKVPKQVAVQNSGRPVCPVGLIWDSTNHSCGYDVFFTSLGCLWSENPELWTERLTSCSVELGLWATVMNGNRNNPEAARNRVRELLHFRSSAKFPQGASVIKLDDLFMEMTQRRSYGSGVTGCKACGYQEQGVTDTLGQFVDVYNMTALQGMYPNGPTLSEWFSYHFDQEMAHCPQCRIAGSRRKMRRLTTIYDIPSLMVVGINFDTLVLDEELNFTQNGSVSILKLRGLIYHSQEARHFTSVVLDASGMMWYHDGITTGRTCVNKGRFGDLSDPLTIHRRDEQRLCAAVYALK